MTSARVFAGASSIWAPLTPTIDSLTHWVNARVEDVGPRVPALGGDPGNNALIAEVAFGLVATRSALELPIDQALQDRIRLYLRGFRTHPPGDSPLDEEEEREVISLARSLARLLASEGDVTFYPKLPGCGVVDSAHADLATTDKLGEVKSVTRAFRASDLKQLLTYCAMAHSVGQVYEEVALYNPRRGVRITASTEFICRAASGLTAPELFEEIQRVMTGLQTSG